MTLSFDYGCGYHSHDNNVLALGRNVLDRLVRLLWISLPYWDCMLGVMVRTLSGFLFYLDQLQTAAYVQQTIFVDCIRPLAAGGSIGGESLDMKVQTGLVTAPS
jgi:hypothetical protein